MPDSSYAKTKISEIPMLIHEKQDIQPENDPGKGRDYLPMTALSGPNCIRPLKLSD